jgi:integrase
VALRTADARKDWGERKSKALGRRRLELEAGAVKKSGMSIGDGIGSYFDAHKALRARTVQDYRACADEFETWAGGAGVVTVDDINKARLLTFRDAAINAPHSRAKDKDVRSAFTVNRILRGTSIVLRWLQERGKLAACSTDDLRTGLKRVRASIDRIAFLGRSDAAALLRACLDHDSSTFAETRAEHRGEGRRGATPRYEPVSPFVLLLLMTGLRFSEALELRWSDVDLDAQGHDGLPSGELYLAAGKVKTKKGRAVAFDVSPTAGELLAILKENRSGNRVFHWLTRPLLEAARKRLKAGGSPNFDWQELRSTCGTFLTNSPGIFGSASAFHSAKRLGHSVSVAEKHYLGTVKGIPQSAKTIEAAMGIEAEAAAVIALAKERFGLSGE